MMSRLLETEGRWIHALLVLGTITVGLILAWIVTNVLAYFDSALLILFLAWLFAFIMSPLVRLILRAVPAIPRTAAVVAAYVGLFLALVAILGVVIASIASSVQGLLGNLDNIQADLPAILASWQSSLNRIGLGAIRLEQLATEGLNQLGQLGNNLAPALTFLALGTLATIGNLAIVVFLSLFMVLDQDRIVAFLNRLVPPRWADEARLFQESVSSAFGGFLRGQVIQGLVLGAFALVGSLLLGIPYVPVTTAFVVILQIIPFFGPFFSWAPPVVAAILTGEPTLDIVLIFAVMAVGWFITMNIVQPRVMANSVGIHPVVVLASILIGLEVAGALGAIFAVPVAAVLSTFFFYYLNRNIGTEGDIASRAARRLEEREGRPVRVPTAPPVAGPAVTELAAGAAAGRRAPGFSRAAPIVPTPPPDSSM
jgi:predicted PurR-regulated permease PerM